VVPGGYRAARGGSRLVDHQPQETPTALATVRDGSLPRTHLLWAAAFLLLEAIAGDAPGDPDTSALALERDLGLAEPDHVLLPALIRVALGLFERRAGHDPAEAALAAEIAGLLGEVKRSVPPSGDPPWPGESLTENETRVLRYLPTHMGTPEIAAELFPLGEHRQDAHAAPVPEARRAQPPGGRAARPAIGLLTVSSVGPKTPWR
jgi:hypothetical protein